MKKINFDNLEVLSPAGNMESFKAALASGADAIYLGLNKFNARMKADNFTTENIRDTIKLAHSTGAKVYITINTLLKDDDFDELINLVNILVQAKADAFIVQDLGVAYVLKSCFKNIVLHASTQMGVHNLEGAKVIEKLGFSRVVLSRETTLEDIKEIRKNTNLEIEYFVQGALCVAFSGNCYLSSVENNASGNEGKCLQLCRLPYKNNLTNETKYYLSAKDLSLLENLPKLIKAGVTSFKIEGRLKHSGYVSVTTKLYKNAINLIKNNIFDVKFLTNSDLILRKTFSRGEFNKSAYLFQNDENIIINSDYQNHIGIKIGTIKNIKKFKDNLNEITLFSTHILATGDGLKFIDINGKQIESLGVGNVESLGNNIYKIFTTKMLSLDLDVYLIQDSKLEKEFLSSKIKLPITLTIIAKHSEYLKLEFTYKNIKFTYFSKEILEKAQSAPIDDNTFISQFQKSTNTIFDIQKIEVISDCIFAPKSLINKWRRESLIAFQEFIISENEKYLNVEFLSDKYNEIKAQKASIFPQNLVIFDENNTNFNKNYISIIEPNNYLTFSKNYDFQNFKIQNAALSLPIIIRNSDKQIINSILSKLPNTTPLFINNISGLYYKIFKNYDVIISPFLNIKNKFAILMLNSLDINKICASIEADYEFINNYKLTSLSNGIFPLMTFSHCPYKSVFKNDCKNCKFNNNLAYQRNSKNYQIKRIKISSCYFYLLGQLKRKNTDFQLKISKNYSI